MWFAFVTRVLIFGLVPETGQKISFFAIFCKIFFGLKMISSGLKHTKTLSERCVVYFWCSTVCLVSILRLVGGDRSTEIFEGQPRVLRTPALF